VIPVKRHAGHERLAVFLEQRRDAVFWFLTAPADISATNHESAFELRFHVIARKLNGGHRSKAGRQAQQTLPSRSPAPAANWTVNPTTSSASPAAHPARSPSIPWAGR
jgi:hypothetical protein